MTDEERCSLLGDEAVAAARQSARDANAPGQVLLDEIAVLVTAQALLLPRDESTPRDAA